MQINKITLMPKKLLLPFMAIFLISCSAENETTSITVPTGSESAVGAVEPEENGFSSVENLEWPLHNFDLYGSRFAPSDQITPDNVSTLVPKWLFQHGVIDGVSNQTTPVIVDDMMYLTDSRGSVYALNARDGHLIWSYDVTRLLGGGRREGYIFRHRGVVYDDGVVYSAAGSCLLSMPKPASPWKASARMDKHR